MNRFFLPRLGLGLCFVLLLGCVFAAETPSAPEERARMAEVEALARATPIHSAWRRMQTGAQASKVLKWHIMPVAARLALPEGDPEREEATRLYLQALRLADNTSDAPWSTTRSLQTTLMYRDRLPPGTMELQKQLLQRWNYPCSAGTINMRLYLHTAGFLASEIWPDFQDAAEPVKTAYAIDFRGKTVRSHTAKEIQEFCRARIYEIFDEFVLRNQVEHDTIYFLCDVEALKMLADFARDPEMRRRATMVLDYFLLNLATDWNQGYMAEPLFRQKTFEEIFGDRLPPSEQLGWLYFGGPNMREGVFELPPVFWHDGYRMPPVFRSIAQDRAEPKEKRESQDGVGPGKATIHKSYLHTPTYSLSSGVTEYDGAAGIRTPLFKEQRMVNLTWISGRPGSRFHVLQENIAQPYFNKTELNYFTSGENPHSQRLHHRRTVIGVYDVPADYPHYRQYTIYRRGEGEVERREDQGWVFAHMGGVVFGFYSKAPTTWELARVQRGYAEGIDVRWCESRRNAWVLETAEAARYPGEPAEQLAAFAREVLSGDRLDPREMEAKEPAFSYRSIHGDTLRIVFAPLGRSLADKHFINGDAVDYASWPMLASPWARQDFGSPLVEVRHAGLMLQYDYRAWTVRGGFRLQEPAAR